MRSAESYANNLRLSREAKRRRRGICEDCGTETRYNGHNGTGVSRLCNPCMNRRIAASRQGTGPLGQRILSFVGDGERRMGEIADVCGASYKMTATALHRLVRYGLLERPAHGVYRKAESA